MKEQASIDFKISSESIRVVRAVLDRPHVPPNPITGGMVYRWSKSILNKLPLSIIKEADLPVVLSGAEVDLITFQILSRRFRESEPAHKRLTRYRQAVWEINLEYLKAGGEIQTNFKNFLQSYKIGP